MQVHGIDIACGDSVLGSFSGVGGIGRDWCEGINIVNGVIQGKDVNYRSAWRKCRLRTETDGGEDCKNEVEAQHLQAIASAITAYATYMSQ